MYMHLFMYQAINQQIITILLDIKCIGFNLIDKLKRGAGIVR